MLLRKSNIKLEKLRKLKSESCPNDLLSTIFNSLFKDLFHTFRFYRNSIKLYCFETNNFHEKRSICISKGGKKKVGVVGNIWTCWKSMPDRHLTWNTSPITKNMAMQDTISAWFWITNSWLRSGGFLFLVGRRIPIFAGLNVPFQPVWCGYQTNPEVMTTPQCTSRGQLYRDCTLPVSWLVKSGSISFG